MYCLYALLEMSKTTETAAGRLRNYCLKGMSVCVYYHFKPNIDTGKYRKIQERHIKSSRETESTVTRTFVLELIPPAGTYYELRAQVKAAKSNVTER